MTRNGLCTTLLVMFCLLARAEAAGTLDRVYICPGAVALIANAQQQFDVFGTDKFGNDVPVAGQITWSVNQAGSIASDGLFTACSVPGVYPEGVRVSVAPGSGTTMTAVATVQVTECALGGRWIFERSWGSHAPGQLNGACGLAVDSQGNVYVADTYNNRIQKFDAEGNYLGQFGNSGGAGQLFWPYGVAADSTDKIYVADTYNNRIVKFDSSGGFLAAYGDDGSGNGQFNHVYDVAIDSSGNMYATDSDNSRVQKLGPSGAFITAWGSAGSGDGQFSRPAGIAVDSAGCVYVADAGNSRVQKFGSSGAFITKWSAEGSGGENLMYPSGVSVDSSGNVLVTDYYHVNKYSSLGVPLGMWGGWGIGPGNFDGAAGIDLSPNGRVYVCERSPDRVQSFSSQGVPIALFGQAVNGVFSYPSAVAIDRLGNSYVGDVTTGRIQKFDQHGRFLLKWGQLGGSVDEELYMINGIALDADSNVYVSDSLSADVHKFDSSGVFVLRWTLPLHDGQSVGSCSIAVSSDGFVYVVPSNPRNVTKYDTDGHLISMWPDHICGNCVIVDSLGFVYLSGSRDVRKYDPSGNLILQWGSSGTGDGQFTYITGLGIDSNDCIYTTDRGNARVQKFDTSGNFIEKFGSHSEDPGGLVMPNGVALDRYGHAVISEDSAYRSGRVQKFVPASSSLGAAKKTPDGRFVYVTGPVVTAGTGQLPDCCYVESTDRSVGIKVTGKTENAGRKVNLIGYLATVDGEREIRAISMAYAGYGGVAALMMNNKALGGTDTADFDPATGAGQRGVEDGEGANNIGMFVKVTGKVSIVGDDFFYIDDGTHAHDASIFTGVRVQCRNLSKPIVGHHVAVSGISRIAKLQGRYFRSIWPRYAADITLN